MVHNILFEGEASLGSYFKILEDKYPVKFYTMVGDESLRIEPEKISPKLCFIGGMLQLKIEEMFNWEPDRFRFPIIGFVGDAPSYSRLARIRMNTQYLTRLYGVSLGFRSPEFPERFRYHHLCHDLLFKSIEREKEYDIAFVGRSYGRGSKRAILISELSKRYKCYIGGKKWDQLGIKNADARKIPVDEVNEIYAKAHLVLSIDAANQKGYTSNRTIMSMCGTHVTLIHDHSGMNYFKKFISNKKHAFYFSTINDIDKILNYVKRRASRARDIGLAARERILELKWTNSLWLEMLLEDFVL